MRGEQQRQDAEGLKTNIYFSSQVIMWRGRFFGRRQTRAKITGFSRVNCRVTGDCRRDSQTRREKHRFCRPRPFISSADSLCLQASAAAHSCCSACSAGCRPLSDSASTVYLHTTGQPTRSTSNTPPPTETWSGYVGNVGDLFPTVGERVDGLAGVVERRQTGALGLSGAPPLQRRWQGGGPLVGHPQALPFQQAHLLAFGLRLVGIRLLD